MRVSLHLVVIFCVLSGLVVWGLTYYSFEVALGDVRVIGVGVGVYWDANCDNPVDSLSWGRIVIEPWKPEVFKNITVHVRNEGINPVVIRFNVSRWSPSGVERYMHLSWDYHGRVLGFDEVVSVTLILSMDPKIWFEFPRIQDYSFDIIISAARAQNAYLKR